VVLREICRRFALSVPPGFEARTFLGVTLLPQDQTLLVAVRRRRARAAPVLRPVPFRMDA
jgi:hypothetical protein